ncbi:unnamed protein product [marine sediment metagenome]|uniref:Uncharacterized protein n=1 Tax=marine sediment metagenome TaxID=412755 RepID=X1KR93_9ZZZZ
MLRSKHSEFMRQLWQDPEYRAKQQAAWRRLRADPEYHSRMSDSMRERWQDPKYVAAVMAGRKASGRKVKPKIEKPASYALYWPALPYSWLLSGEGLDPEVFKLGIEYLCA